MNVEKIGLMIEWLGTDGAIAGIEKCTMTNKELITVFSKQLESTNASAKRIEIIHQIIFSIRSEMMPSPDELMNMNKEQLLENFHSLNYSKDEVLNLLQKLDIRPKTQSLKSLIKFAVNELEEISMYKRIAKGSSVDG